MVKVGKLGAPTRKFIKKRALTISRPPREQVAQQPQESREEFLARQERIKNERERFDKVITQLQREAEGKGGSILDTASERRLREEFLKDPRIREAVERGSEVRGAALQAGFTGPAAAEEFIIESRARQEIKERMKRTPRLPTETEKELGMSLPEDLRDLPPEEVVAGQSLIQEGDFGLRPTFTPASEEELEAGRKKRFLEKVEEFAERGREKVVGFVSPAEGKRRQIEKEIARRRFDEVRRFNEEVVRFEDKYGNRELSPDEYAEASETMIDLQEKERILKENEGKIETTLVDFEQARAMQPLPEKVGVSFATELLAFPLSTAGFVSKLALGKKEELKVGLKETKGQLIADPIPTLAGFAGASLPAEFIAIPIRAGVGKISPLTATRIAIETEAGTQKIVSFGVKAGARAKPIVTLTDESVMLGLRPDVSGTISKLKAGVDLKPASALETEIVKQSLTRLGAERVEAIGVGQTIIRKTKGVKSSFIDPKFVRELSTERLTAPATQAVLKLAKEEKGVVFGSGARRVQVPEKISTFKPRDIDIELPVTSPEAILKVQEKAVVRLKKLGVDARISKDIEGAVEVKVGKEYMKAVEFKARGVDLLETEIVPEKVLGFKKEARKVKIGGQKFTRLEQELRGVMQGVVRVRKVEGKLQISPPPKRVKDIASVKIAAETLRQSRFIPSKKLDVAITKFSQLFRVPKEGVGARIPLADFTPRRIKFPEGQSPFIISPRTGVSPVSVRSVSASVSPKIPSPTVSVSTFPSVSTSGFFKVSPFLSPKISPSPKVSPFISPSVSVSPKGSPYISPSPSPSPFEAPPITPFIIPPLDQFMRKEETRRRGGYNVFARPIKGKGFMKVNLVPLTKSRAEDLRDFTLDTSLARTGEIRPTKRKPKKARIKSPAGYSKSRGHKFRKYKQVKGKKKQLPRGRVIERGKHLLDTPREKKQITLRKRISELRKGARKVKGGKR